MREISLREAKTNFSAVVDQAIAGSPSIITRRGKRQAVILSFEDWQRLSRVPSFGRLLMSAPTGIAALPKRGKPRVRNADL